MSKNIARGRARPGRRHRTAQLAFLTWIAVVAFVPARSSGAQTCVGDCDVDGSVSISELVRGVGIALGTRAADCAAFENQNGIVDIAQLIKAVNNALLGCSRAPTPTSSSTITVDGSCSAPGNGSRELVACAAGTPITAFRCDAREECLHGDGLTILDQSTVANDGSWSVRIPMADASATLLFQASFPGAIVYRVLDFGTVGASLRAGGVIPGSARTISISPISEAAVALLDDSGFENYSDAGAQQVVDAVEQAAADVSFAGDTVASAIDHAVQTASEDPTVIMVLQSARNTPTPTPTLTPTVTGTPTTMRRFQVSLHTAGAAVAGVQVDMAADVAAIPDPLRPGNYKPSCCVNPTLKKDATIFGFLHPPMPTGPVRAVVLSLTNVDPIPEGSTLFTCNLASGSPGGVVLSEIFANDPNGNALDIGEGGLTVESAGSDFCQ